MATFTGTTGPDTYYGTEDSDLIEGLAGNDLLVGNGGDDVIDGGDDNDTVSGGNGLDELRGGAGDDVVMNFEGLDSLGYSLLDGGDGFDWLEMTLSSYTGALTIDLQDAAGAVRNFERSSIHGGSGVVTFRGSSGIDIVYGGASADYLEGRDGDDDLRGGGGNDMLLGGDGIDLLIGDGGFDQLYGGDGDDLLNAGVSGSVGGSYLEGGAGNDSLVARDGEDTLVGGEGDDVLDGGADADEMTGGTGNDVYAVDNGGDVVTENAGEGTDEVQTSLAVYVLAANVENLTTFSSAAHDFRGNGGDNIISAWNGNDILRLYDGGVDTVFARAGNDNIFFGGTLTAADRVVGGTGTDTLVLQGDYAGGLTLTNNVTQIENISLLAGSNTSFGEPGTNRYDYVLTTSDFNFAAGLQARINGAALLAGEDFTFNGSAETGASFVVYGGKGVDTLTGGLGNDIFFFAEERFATGDTVNGGPGYDGMFLRGNYVIDFNAPGYTGLFTNIENLTLTSATDERYARGGGTEFDYHLTLSNAIVKPGETLTISGALLMASETMYVDGSVELDGFLRLFGGAAIDTLIGSPNADLIHGNLGGDALTGSGGADVFRYQSTAESAPVAGYADTITDFAPGVDKIDLSRIDADSLVAGDQAFTWIGANAFSGTAGELRVHYYGPGWIVEGDVNGDGAADLYLGMLLEQFTSPPPTQGDFIL